MKRIKEMINYLREKRYNTIYVWVYGVIMLYIGKHFL